MISDKQRREVAARLRDEAEAWRTDNGDDTVYSMSDCAFTESVLTAFGFDDMEMDAYRIFEKMADLIDRPTCYLELTDVETHGNAKVRIYECSECGRTCEEIYGKYERCPHCGCEVVEDD